MANWLNTIHFTDVLAGGEADLENAAKAAATRIRALIDKGIDVTPCGSKVKMEMESMLAAVEAQFQAVNTVADFDSALEALHNLGDLSLDGRPHGRKFLWIETIAEKETSVADLA